jgi:hypothetical protein
MDRRSVAVLRLDSFWGTNTGVVDGADRQWRPG